MRKGHGVFAALNEGRQSTWQLFAPPLEQNAIGLNVDVQHAWAAVADPAERALWDFGLRGVVQNAEDKSGTLLERRFAVGGKFHERLVTAQPPEGENPGIFETELSHGKGLLKTYKSRFVVSADGRFSRVEATVYGDISPFFLRRWLGGVLAAWLGRSLARLKEYVEEKHPHSL